jgi:hypothetical protein
VHVSRACLSLPLARLAHMWWRWQGSRAPMSEVAPSATRVWVSCGSSACVLGLFGSRLNTGRSLLRDSGTDYREHWSVLTGCASNGEAAPVCVIGQGSKTPELKAAMTAGLARSGLRHLNLQADDLLHVTESGNSNTEIFEHYIRTVRPFCRRRIRANARPYAGGHSLADYSVT